MERIILDVDSAGDDILAVLFAAISPSMKLEGITTCTGAAGPIDQVTNVVLNTLALAGKGDVPVAKGAWRPIVGNSKEDMQAPVHFEKRLVARFGDRLAKFNPPAPTPTLKVIDKHAVDFIIDTALANPGEITLVVTGPMTNAAMAFLQEPKLAQALKRMVLLGGNFVTPGNITPLAEFNIWADPEAAARVFSAGFEKVTLVTLDATHRALVSYADCDHLAMLGTPAGQATSDIVRFRIEMHDISQKMEVLGTAPVHDAVCVAYLVDRAILTTRHLHVDVETSGGLTVGRTVIDTHFRGNREPNADVAFDADPRRFVAMLTDIFARPHG